MTDCKCWRCSGAQTDLQSMIATYLLEGVRMLHLLKAPNTRSWRETARPGNHAVIGVNSTFVTEGMRESVRLCL